MSVNNDEQQSPEPQKNDKPVVQEARQLAVRAKTELVAFRTYPDAGWLGGVCAGIAYRFGVPTWIVRLTWFLLFACAGVGFVPYLVLWVFVPEAGTPSDYVDRTGDQED